MTNFIDTIKQNKLPSDQYVDKVYSKHQLYLHHTASDSDPYSVIKWWKDTKEAVGTAFVIAGRTKSDRWKDGDIFQCFSSQKAAWHLGLTQKHLNVAKPGNKTSSWLNLDTVGVEITCWGQLVKSPKGYKTYAGTYVPEEHIQEYTDGFRGYHYYEKYSDAQLESARELLLYLCDRYDIDKKFKGMEMFDIDKRALRGENGIWSHVSVRPDKFDCHPQPELIQMLKSL